MPKHQHRAYRLDVQLVHQDPYASLNPSQTIGSMLAAPLRRHRLVEPSRLKRRVHDLLEAVELSPPEQFARRHPHELSGGQRQRAAIARALTVDPALLVADEAVSMVDVSLRMSILQVLRRQRAERGLSVVFITHDLALARNFAPDARLLVMYLGRIVEIGHAATVIGAPQHPYTRALVDAATLRRGDARAPTVSGPDTPSPLNRPSGCAFHPRCPEALPVPCQRDVPLLRPLAGDWQAACHLRESTASASATRARISPRSKETT
jgi:oligopeptide/dipeptide ABC transporter ATP-binding protein